MRSNNTAPWPALQRLKEALAPNPFSGAIQVRLRPIRVAMLEAFHGARLDPRVLMTDDPRPGSCRYYPAGQLKDIT